MVSHTMGAQGDDALDSSDDIEEVHDFATISQAESTVATVPANPLDDTGQLDHAIAQRRARVGSLQTERQAHESQLAQIANQQKMLAQRELELRHALKRNESQRQSALKDLDNMLQTRTRLQSLQQQASLAAAQSRAALQARAALSASLRPMMSPQTGPPPAAQTVPQPAQTTPPAAQTAQQSASTLAAAAPPAATPPTATTAPTSAPPPAAATAMTSPPQPDAAAAARTRPPPIARANRLPLAVEVDFTSETNLFMGFSENISEGGLFVATEKPAPIGTRIAVAFTLPNQRDPIRCETAVAWAVEEERQEQVAGMGLKFLNLTETDRERLRAFISIREPLFFPG